MNRLVTAELLKLRTTRTAAVVVAAAIAVAVLLGVANSATAGGSDGPALGSPAWTTNVLGVSTIPAVIAVLLGVLLAAGEYQHRTITTTFLATPRRAHVVTAKALAAAIAGPVLATAMVIASAAATIPSLVANGASLDLFHRDAGLTLLGLLVASSLLGTVGVLLGTLIRSQVAAVVVVAAWALVIEGVIDTLAGGRLRPWLPGGAAADLAGNGGQSLWVATAVVVAWTAILTVTAIPATVRHDVT